MRKLVAEDRMINHLLMLSLKVAELMSAIETEIQYWERLRDKKTHFKTPKGPGDF